MEPRIQAPRKRAIQDLEDRHRSFLLSRNSHLDRVILLQQERRAQRRAAIVDTVVTYGAYEDPI